MTNGDTIDPMMGARPIKRLIQEKIKLPLSELVLFGYLQDGDEVEIAVKDDEIVLLKK